MRLSETIGIIPAISTALGEDPEAVVASSGSSRSDVDVLPPKARGSFQRRCAIAELPISRGLEKALPDIRDAGQEDCLLSVSRIRAEDEFVPMIRVAERNVPSLTLR